MKFQEDILNGFQVAERTRFCDGQTDGRTDDPGKNKNISPNPKGGDIITARMMKNKLVVTILVSLVFVAQLNIMIFQ